VKRANKGAQSAAAESVEGRRPAKGNMLQTATRRTQRRISGSPGLQRVRAAARRDKRARFTALLHHITAELLRESFYSLKRSAAPGIDDVTWRQYADGLGNRLSDLHGRVHQGTYRAQPSRRTYIPKPDGRQRPIGIAALEDKIVQQATATVLRTVYEEDFRGFSYGFRPGRRPHDALDAVWVGIVGKKVNWVLDCDIRSFFDSLSHEWMLKFLRHRIADRRIQRLVAKWLRAGVSEDGTWTPTTVGTPQGAVISPLLGNVYLHYVLDVWVDWWRKTQATGDVIIVRYADDFVMGFQHCHEARRFLQLLKERFERFGLEVHPDKTRLLEFGRFAAENRRRRGKKVETFDFLGFTHICGRARTSTRFLLKRWTTAKRMRAKLQAVKEELRKRRHQSIRKQGAWLCAAVRGYFNYHAVPLNGDRCNAFRAQVSRHWLRSLRRRSQRHRLSWARFKKYVRRWIPPQTILHPYPNERFYARHTQGKSRMR
jgi:group II intron reverse transcriptase/maturase